MATILKARPLIDHELEQLKVRCDSLKRKNIVPSLKIFLVGHDPASQIYTRNKKKFCEKYGAQCEIINLNEKIRPDEFLSTLQLAIKDKNVHGCLVQLPVPQQLRHLDIENIIPPHKDVDGFHLENLGALFKGTQDEHMVPCTPKGIMALLDFYQIPIAGKKAVVVGRSLIVGKPMSLLLTNRDATVTLCHSKTPDLPSFTKEADIIVMAIGRAKYLKKEHLSPNKKQVIIDVGMNHDENGKLCGDVDFEEVKDHVQAITPVPGGVGPLTILSLSQNLLTAAERQLNKD